MNAISFPDHAFLFGFLGAAISIDSHFSLDSAIRIHNPTGRRIRLPSFRSFIEAYCRQNSWDSTVYNSLSKYPRTQLEQEPRSNISPNGMAFVNQVFGSGDMEEDLDESMLNVINPERDLSSPLFHPDYPGLSTEQDNNESLLRELVSHDPLYELSEQEKSALWRNRYFCMKNFPEALPLVDTVFALQLLGAMGLNASMVGEVNAAITSAAGQGARGGASGIPDAYVRELAVNSLYDLSDAELSDYLLQLVQIRIHNPTGRRIRLPSFRSFIEAYCFVFSGTSFLGFFPQTVYNSLSKYPRTQLEQEPRSNISPNGMAFVNQVFGSGDMEEDLDESMLNVINPERDLSSPLFHPDYPGLSTEQDNNESLLRELVSHDPLYELSEQEKSALWRNRYFCMKNFPEALPLVDTVFALQLLGAMGLNASMVGEVNAAITSAAGQGARGGASGIPDAYVRELAVNSLYDLSDAELSDYLLQLVQALKAEAYLDNCLSRFILFRALRNPLLIGLRLFWHLRSEIHLPDMHLKFGLLLEAFCLGCGPLLTFLARQVTALNRLETISARVKELTNEDEQRSRFREEVSRPEARRDLEWLPSPLCLTERLGKLIIDKCDVKRSKKRPLWIVWSNSDRLATHHHAYYQLIFKHGDDLRQDMLTLQILRVMDRIWKNEGMDMCLVPYGCLATGPEMGLIEAVRNARTVMSIQGERLRAALQIDNTQLFKWLMQHISKTRDPTSQNENGAYERLIHNFTMSCAGYCVATFGLGIRDRHPDNIMVDTSGRLFHIDFGHILDNRKKKFGITRERVPFVLTKDFITVIAHGNPDVVLGAPVTDTGGGGSRNKHFQEFTQLCGRAYLLLRKHANLLLTLFAMMLPSGLPELTSVCDLEYVRKTLAVELSEEQALAYFHGKFNEAYYGAWTTKIDWFGHWMNT
ncbi:hypothetical protein AHF37_03893 [Paragonimus kellicotti]|nr:hypothetical protein AHF37_03893 [Paragonimus kellicotti]